MHRRYRIYVVKEDLHTLSLVPGDLIIEKGLSILKKLPRSYIINIFAEEAPLIVRSEGSGKYVASILGDKVISERKSEEGIGGIMRGFSTLSDALVYLMDTSMDKSLPNPWETIYFWLHVKVLGKSPVMDQEVEVAMEPKLVGLLNFLRRKILAYQLIYLKNEGLV